MTRGFNFFRSEKSSVAKPHHFYTAPAPATGKNFDAATAPAPQHWKNRYWYKEIRNFTIGNKGKRRL
jgi:hypothetical protein